MTSSGSGSPPPTRLKAKGAGRTHKGRIRETNEDAILQAEQPQVWAVADGMGGYGHGADAAAVVIRELQAADWSAHPQDAINAALGAANSAIVQKARQNGLRRMGSTVITAVLRDGHATLGWVGDSRAYLMRDGRLKRLTRDHSWVADMIERGDLSPDEEEAHPDRNIITRAIGTQDELSVDFHDVSLRRDDTLVLCSDGLHTCISESDILALASKQSETEAVEALLDAALDLGAPDNVSAVVIKIVDQPA